jgi:hypothetical protein
MDCITSNFLNNAPHKSCCYVIYPSTCPEAVTELTELSPAKSSRVWLKKKLLHKTGQFTLHRVLDTSVILRGSNKEYGDDTCATQFHTRFTSVNLNSVGVKTVRTSEDLFLSYILFSLWCCYPTRAMATSFLRFLERTKRRTTVGRTPLKA